MNNAQADNEGPGAPPDNVFSSGARFADAEVAALRSERDRLIAALAIRTEAWRSALRELSEAEAELAQMRGEVAIAEPDVLSHADWEHITGPLGQGPNQAIQG